MDHNVGLLKKEFEYEQDLRADVKCNLLISCIVPCISHGLVNGYELMENVLSSVLNGKEIVYTRISNKYSAMVRMLKDSWFGLVNLHVVEENLR